MSSVSGFLHSIAHQMASLNTSIREKLIEIQQDDPHLEDNVRRIWRKVFVGEIFRATFYQTNYWVIDALDECCNEGRNYAGLFSLMAKIENSVPLKVFLLSRTSSDLEKLFMPLTFVTEQMSVDDSLPDIRAFCVANSFKLPVTEGLALQKLINRIVEKSAGWIIKDGALFQGKQLGTGSIAASAMAAIFNPNPDVNLLAVTYMDGELAMFDTYYRGMITSVVTDAEVLAASPDGRNLVSGDSSGKIYLLTSIPFNSYIGQHLLTTLLNRLHSVEMAYDF